MKMLQQMKSKLRKAALALAVVALPLFTPSQATAGLILSDNFDTAPLQLNWPGDSVFDSLGTNLLGQTISTDLIGNPGFFNFLPGNGRYVDLDGSTGNGDDPAGILRSKATFGAGDYTLSFRLAGNQRGQTPRFTDVFLGNDLIASLLPAANAPFTLYSFNFSSAGGKLIFSQRGPSNQQGNLLDDVNLSVPEPSTITLIAMALLSMFGLGMMRRRAEV
jgi:hypothetical protein